MFKHCVIGIKFFYKNSVLMHYGAAVGISRSRTGILVRWEFSGREWVGVCQHGSTTGTAAVLITAEIFFFSHNEFVFTGISLLDFYFLL